MKKIFLALFAIFVIILSLSFTPSKKTLFIQKTLGEDADNRVVKIITQKSVEGYKLISLVSYQKHNENTSFLIVMEK